MIKTTYRPRRAPSRYLVGAPDYILCARDAGPSLDAERYSICLGGRMLDPVLLWARKVHCLVVSPGGASYFTEVNGGSRRALGRLVAWADLPEAVRNAVTSRAARQ